MTRELRRSCARRSAHGSGEAASGGPRRPRDTRSRGDVRSPDSRSSFRWTQSLIPLEMIGVFRWATGVALAAVTVFLGGEGFDPC